MSIEQWYINSDTVYHKYSHELYCGGKIRTRHTLILIVVRIVD